MPLPLSAEKKELICASHHAGLQQEQIAQTACVSRNTVRRVLEAKGLISVKRRRRLSSNEMDSLMADYWKGHFSHAELARRYSVSKDTLWNILNRNKITARRRYTVSLSPEFAQILGELAKKDNAPPELVLQGIVNDTIAKLGGVDA